LQTLQSDIPLLEDLKLDEVAGLSYTDLQDKLQEAVKLAYQVREEHVTKEVMREMERQILMRTIDTKWVDYLHNIEQLREGIHLRGYGQRDPLQEYKREAYQLFEALLRSIQTESIQLIFRAQFEMVNLEELEQQMEMNIIDDQPPEADDDSSEQTDDGDEEKKTDGAGAASDGSTSADTDIDKSSNIGAEAASGASQKGQ
jgi:preprotein translocase subunit SecA